MWSAVAAKEFLLLRTAWAEQPGSRGGILALAGFHFQIGLALVEVIRRHQDGANVFIEALSDVVTRDSGRIIITQAKRTLSSGSLGKALEELWLIDCLARKVIPETAPQLAYRVVVARTVLRDWESSFDRWTPRDEVDRDALARFKARLDCSCAPDPRLEASHLLMLQFKDAAPLDRVDKFIGQLIAAADRDAFDDVTENIRLELLGLRNAAERQQRKFHLFGLSDQPPSETYFEPDSRKAIRIGERLTISDLRDGRLANRTIYEAIQAECENWLLDIDSSGGKLPVFWIEGRSGAGKSASLLHLLARLHGQDPSRAVLWLGERSDLIADAVAWAGRLLCEGHRLMIGVDDPYTAERRAGFEIAVRNARDEWDSIRNSELEAEREAPITPVIICCGPTEQREDAKDACGADIEIQSYVLPKETKDDLDELAEWFRERTGRRVPNLDGDVLLVQRFFEWSKGDISDFARRFKGRLLSYDEGRGESIIFNTIAAILALGRLYADYPAAALLKLRESDPEVERAFIQLAEEEAHFAFGRDPLKDMPIGVRFTHPHLADAVYRAWFGRPSDRGYRRQHLREGIRAALAQNDLSHFHRIGPLRAISAVASGRSPLHSASAYDLRERLEFVSDELRDVLPELYQEFFGDVRPHIIDLSIWTNLDFALQLELKPDPLEALSTAVAAIREPVSGVSTACKTLLEHRTAARSRVDVVSIVACVINRLADWRNAGDLAWAGWPTLASNFIIRVGVASITSSIEQLARTYPRWPGLAQLMIVLAWQLDKQPAARNIVLDWLELIPTWIPAWPQVLRNVHEQTSRCDRSDRLAIRFLSDQANHVSWGLVWEDLWDDNVLDRRVLERAALLWLSCVNPSNSRWQRIWQKLLCEAKDDATRRATLFSKARIWLNDVNASHISWQYVWQILWTELNDDPDERMWLEDLAWSWLTEVDANHGSWNYIWIVLWEIAKDDQESRGRLRALADNWLATVSPAHGGWKFVWEQLWNELEADSRRQQNLAKSANRWIRRVDPNHGSWNYVWQELWNSTKPNTDERLRLAGIGASWLDDVHPEHGGWNWVWRKLWQAAQSDSKTREKLRTQARSWLCRRSFSNGGWTFVWQDLLRVARQEGRNLGELQTLADAWLDFIEPNDGSWQFVWIDLWEAATPQDKERRNELIQRADSWLRSVDIEHGGWPYVWQKLWEAAKDDPVRQNVVITHAQWWLAISNPKLGGWKAIVKQVMEDAQRNPERLPRLEQSVRTATGRSDLDRDTLFALVQNRWQQNASELAWIIDWKRKWKKEKDDPESRAELIELAISLLARADPKEIGWKSVWKKLWKFAADKVALRDTLADMAIKLLPGASPSHSRWPYVWKALWLHARDDPNRRNQLATIAQGWLETVDIYGREALSFLLYLLTESNDYHTFNSDVVAAGMRWLHAWDVRDTRWPVLWQRLWKHKIHDFSYRSILAERAMARLAVLDLKDSWSRGIWKQVWQDSTSSDPFRASVANYAENWIRQNPDHSPWAYVWSELVEFGTEFEAARRHSLMVEGLEWLRHERENKEGWEIVFAVVIRVCPQNDELDPIYQRLLISHPPNAFSSTGA